MQTRFIQTWLSSQRISHPTRRRRYQWRDLPETLEMRVLLSAVNPYLQNPASDAMTVMWFTQENVPGTLTVNIPGGGTQIYTSTPVLASALAYAPSEVPLLPGGVDPGIPFQHRIRVTGLQPGTTYSYSVQQGSQNYTSQFKTIPSSDSSVRFVVYGDPETEPESTGDKVEWDIPFSSQSRQYVVDQTEGYKQNQNIIESRNPDFIGITGDILDAGGEQRDWDEFWKHNSGDYNDVAAHIPILPAPGNHDDYGGPGELGGYSDAGAIRARDKYKTFFEVPSNGSGVSTYEGRYYRVDYGPITYITLDVSNGLPDQSSQDTNWFLGPNPGFPDFNPGSTQYQWLEAQLADAQTKSQFIFVQFHHAPYSVGPHGFPAGSGTGFDTQSGQPVRALTPLFQQYGVAAVLAGHDEMYQHSLVGGIHFYEIGTGGDELRGPSSGTDGSSGLPTTNPDQVFLPHLNAPEVWNGKQLVSGGKHYGHLEVNVFLDVDGFWKAKIEPAYAFPLMDTNGNVTGWERRVYDDVVLLTAGAANASNHAPVLNPDGSPILSAIVEDVAVASNQGTLISSIISSMGPSGGISDADAGDPQGIAVIGANQSSGVWQYSKNGGSSWSDFGSTSSSSALLLASNSQTRVRFVPNANFSGEVGLTYVAWDQTQGANGGKRNATNRGANTSFSLNKETAFISVTPTQDAPVLNPAGNPTLISISEDIQQGNNPGTLISDIISSMGPDGGINNIDPAPGQGIAIIGANQNNGKWQFSTSGGANWSDFGTTSSTSALLLASTPATRIRFLPKKDYWGSVGLTYLAWDQTSGSNGASASTVDRGGATAFSLEKETAYIQVVSVNDAPVLNPAGDPVLKSIPRNISDENNLGTLVSDIIASMGPKGGITDIDNSFTRGIGVIGTNQSKGVWQYSTNGGSIWTNFGNISSGSALLLGSSTRVRFKPIAGFTGVVGMTFVAWDLSSGTIGETVSAVNRGLNSSLSIAKENASISVT